MLWLNMSLSVTIDHVQSHPLLWLNSVMFISWTDLISSSPLNWYNYFHSFEFTWLSLIIFLHIESYVLTFTLHVEDGEIRSQSYYREYDWLGPDTALNTQGQYILIFLVVLITLTKYGLTLLKSGFHQWLVPKSGSHYITLERMLL